MFNPIIFAAVAFACMGTCARKATVKISDVPPRQGADIALVRAWFVRWTERMRGALFAALRMRWGSLRSTAYRNRVGHNIVRHMCADGLLSRPRPSLGCL